MDSYELGLALSCSAEVVYSAVATQAGLRGWWTTDCEVAEAVGGLATFRFGMSHHVMRIEERTPSQAVCWTCIDQVMSAPGWFVRVDEWIGTVVEYWLAPRDDTRCTLVFRHRGLTPDLECYRASEMLWNYYLTSSLKPFVEAGRGLPHSASSASPIGIGL